VALLKEEQGNDVGADTDVLGNSHFVSVCWSDGPCSQRTDDKLHLASQEMLDHAAVNGSHLGAWGHGTSKGDKRAENSSTNTLAYKPWSRDGSIIRWQADPQTAAAAPSGMIFQERNESQVLLLSRMPLQTVTMTDLLSVDRKKRSIDTFCRNERVTFTAFEHERSKNLSDFFAAHLTASVQDPHADDAIAEATQRDSSASVAWDHLKSESKWQRTTGRTGNFVRRAVREDTGWATLL